MSNNANKKRAGSIITFREWDGKLEHTVLGIGTIITDPDKLSMENRSRALKHGINQRVRDAGALSVNPETGKPATPQEKFDAMKRISDHLNSGTTEWNLKPAASTGADSGLTLMAIMRVYGKSLDEAEGILASTMEKRNIDRAAALKLWASSDKIAKAILDIKSERLAAANPADSDDLLDEIEAAGDESGGEGEEEDDSGDDEAPF